MPTQIAPAPKLQFFDANGEPLAGGKLYSYAAGTTTPQATYTDYGGVTANANPIILDSRGETSVWFGSLLYKLKLTTSADVEIWTVDNIGGMASLAQVTELSSQLAASGGSSLIGFLQAGTGAIARTVQSKLRDGVSIKDFGAVGNGIADDEGAIQKALNTGDAVYVPKGTYVVGAKMEINYPATFGGAGAPSIISTTGAFPAAEIFEIFHAPGIDPKGWTIEDLVIKNNGSATHAFTMNVSTLGGYMSKFTLRNVICANQVSGAFFELVNTTPQMDGFFTSYISDNWSLGGYYLENIGDSVFFERNTTSGAGRGYYINQLPTASHVVIRDGNCTSAGGGLLVAQGYNITFQNMQVECPVTFTGSNNAILSANSPSALITNLRILDNNVNAQTVNPTVDCINLDDTQSAVISGNSLYCDSTSGQHIVIGSNARDTYIGSNSYYNSATGADLAAKIVDNGIGTKGIWKNATIVIPGWGLVDPTNGFPVGYFKDIDGTIFLRGNISGVAPGSANLLFVLPVGFRPRLKVVVQYLPYSASANAAVQIEPTGAVTLLTGTATAVYLDGVSFSTK